MYCYRHPKAETGLSCGKCEKPICIRCMVSGPAGIRCPDCASLRASHLYKANVVHLIVQAGIGILAGLIGSFLVEQIGFFFFFIFFAAPAYGGAVAELMLKAIGRKHGKVVEMVGGLSVAAGGLLPLTFIAFTIHAILSSKLGSSGSMLVESLLSTSWRPLLGVGIAAFACYGRLKYF